MDHRGSLFEAATCGHPFWSEPIVHIEWVVTAPGMIKGWGMHLESVDRYVVGTGRIRVVLHDGRVDSPTYREFAQFHFSDESPLSFVASGVKKIPPPHIDPAKKPLDCSVSGTSLLFGQVFASSMIP